MKLSANFSLAEMTKSQTATRKGIKNEPSTAHVENLIHLAETVLQPVREHFVKAVEFSFKNAGESGHGRKCAHASGDVVDGEQLGEVAKRVAGELSDRRRVRFTA